MNHLQFIAFMVCMCVERIWETFFCWSTKPGKVHEKWTLGALTTTHTAIVISSIVEHFLSKSPPNMWMQYVGLFLFLSGVTGRIMASRELGVFHSPQIEIREDHILLKGGLYRITRHPYYISVALELIGFPLFVNTPYTLIIVLALYFPLLVYRAKKEGLYMLAHFGDEYLRF
jgi:methyltransferase